MISIAIPLAKPLPSAANVREHWAVKAKRVAAQRRQVALHLALSPAFKAHRRALATHMFIACTLTRVASRKLDDDNLAHAFKAVRDQVAEAVGLDDGSSRWRWRYAQESGEPGYRIELEVAR